MKPTAAQRLLRLTEAIKKEGMDKGKGKVTARPPFFEVDKENDIKATPVEKPNLKLDKENELKRGVNDKFLGDWDDTEIVDNTEKDIRVVEFRDASHFEEAMRILADDIEIGHPTYEKGVDNKSMIFHLWKANDAMKERIEKAIARLTDYGIVQDTKYYPHVRKNK